MTESKYRLPTDRRIFAAMSDTRRQTSTNLAAMLDLDRRYVSSRLKFLREKGYLFEPGPADQSRMFEPTTMGRIAIFHKEKLIRKYTEQFEYLCGHIYKYNQEIDGQFYPDLLATTYENNVALRELADIDGLTIPSELSDKLNVFINVRDNLYFLYFWSLAERKDKMDVYELTSRGSQYLSLLSEDAFEDPDFGENQISEMIENTDAIREEYTKQELDRLAILTRCIPKDEPSDVLSFEG